MQHDLPDTLGVSDLEIVADLFRLGLSGRYRKVSTLLKEAQALYPQEPAERINKCLGQLADTFRATDYAGFNSLKKPGAISAA